MKVFKNTFAPSVENQELTVDGIIRLLFIGVIKYKDLPAEIRPYIDEKMQRRTNTIAPKTEIASKKEILKNRKYGFGSGFEEREEVMPEGGFNVCEFDDFAPPGEMLTVYDHVDTYEEAEKLKAKYEAQGMKIYIYPAPEARM